MSRLLQGLLGSLGAGLVALLLIAAPPAASQPSEQHDPKLNIPFGMPGKAKKSPDSHEAYLIERPQYVLSYNNKTKTPNWVSWQLTHHDLGKADRGPFKPDPLLPKGFTHITEAPYTGSGFDRGHMCPFADRSATQEDGDATFYMTNIVPQSPHSNQKGWERMETYCRNLAKHGKQLIICCGPWGVGGEGKHGKADTIGSGKGIITVPAKLWKVVLVLKKDEVPSKATRTIAVIVPNDQSVDHHWPKYRVAVSKVEEMTGLNFWPKLTKSVAKAIKAEADDTDIHVDVPKGK
jgi:endonuclease G